MAYLTDKEKRLLFSALTREKKVCVEVDKECCREAYEDTLESVVKNLEKNSTMTDLKRKSEQRQ